MHNAHKRHHKVVIMGGKLKIFCKPRVFELGRVSEKKRIGCNGIYNYSVYITFINEIKTEKSTLMCILHSSFYRCRVLKNHCILCRKVKSPSCSNQSYLNTPDVVITTCQLVSTNVPGGLEHSRSPFTLLFSGRKSRQKCVYLVMGQCTLTLL